MAQMIFAYDRKKTLRRNELLGAAKSMLEHRVGAKKIDVLLRQSVSP
jgi:hypothetical protein